MSSLIDILKDVSIKIVGNWYCSEIDQYFSFDFNPKLLRMGDIEIKNKQGTIKTKYGLAIGIVEDVDDAIYFDVGELEMFYYHVLSIDKNKMVIREFFMRPNTKPLSPLTYINQPPLNVADDILKGLDSI